MGHTYWQIHPVYIYDNTDVCSALVRHLDVTLASEVLRENLQDWSMIIVTPPGIRCGFLQHTWCTLYLGQLIEDRNTTCQSHALPWQVRRWRWGGGRCARGEGWHTLLWVWYTPGRLQALSLSNWCWRSPDVLMEKTKVLGWQGSNNDQSFIEDPEEHKVMSHDSL